MKTFEFIVNTPLGIHARPAAMLVYEAKKASSSVRLSYRGKQINGKDIIAVLTMNIPEKAKVTVMIEGIQEESDARRLQRFCELNL